MDSCQCQGLERETKKWVLEDLALHRKGRPAKTTRLLVSALISEGIERLSLLDIGGGIGVVQIELLRSGAIAATSVEASSAYLQVARKEAARASLERRVTHVHGDFVSLAASIPDADIVTLDRVICCYDDVKALVSLSAAKARTLYGAVYPRSSWWTRVPLFFENLGYRLRRSPFRAFVHPSQVVDQLIRDAGLRLVFQQNTFAWQVVVYKR